ncbi:MAG: hypothetical protein QNJ97_24830 [Myxococcota bacterium]|nr:hypothetical protein [Myxococcota bacterium]
MFMIKLTLLLLLIGCVIVGIIAVGKPLEVSEDNAADIGTVDTVQSTASLGAKILKKSIPSLKSMQSATSIEHMGLASTGDLPMLSLEQIRTLQRQQTEQSIRVYDGAIEHEGIDHVKAARHRRQIERLLDGTKTLRGTALSDVRCAKTLCRVQLSHDDRESQDRFREYALNQAPWDTDQFGGVTHREGGFGTYLYYSVPGQPLPPVH